MNESNGYRPGTLAGRMAVVTGASSEIGAAIAATLAQCGANLVLLARSEARLRTTIARVRRANGATIEGHVIDLTHDAGIFALAQALQTRPDALDILVHAAGEYGRGAIADVPIGDLDRQYQMNLRAPYLLTQRLLPLLRRRGGDVVFINSTQGIAPGRDLGAYAATQHGRAALAESLRSEINDAGVRVLSVFLGRTASRRQEQLFAAEGRPYPAEKLMQPEDVAEMVAAALCLSRRAEVMSIRIRPTEKTY